MRLAASSSSSFSKYRIEDEDDNEGEDALAHAVLGGKRKEQAAPTSVKR